ncbi:hypothetical protein LPJ66_001217 [Kickxella alabastrina]|uniref:Uncharacterized protein n=1 Tax=Kickxella alabastrina TaxID=61397 RepID=A0ACC1ITY3_9FUNG|nr:hypothetical protein LPJ66_001217 [Kickxella alabastrina]
MNGEFTFRASADDVEQDQQREDDYGDGGARDLSEEFEHFQPWDSPRLHVGQPLLSDTSTMIDDSAMGSAEPFPGYDSIGAQQPQDSASGTSATNHYHYYYQQQHHHHHHYPSSNSNSNKQGYASRKRHIPSENDFPVGEPMSSDPLTWYLENNPGSLGPASGAAAAAANSGSNAWLAQLLRANEIGGEWIDKESVSKRWSQRRDTVESLANDDGEFSRYDPHWDDMITFRQTRMRVPRERAWSGSETSSICEPTVNVRKGGWRRMLPLATHPVGRALVLTALPVLVVLLWCSVPLRTDTVIGPDGPVERLNFWFFLFFYYGIYNAVALSLVTQIFHVYSLTWWPRSMSGVLANVISWVFTTSLGALVYTLDTGIEKDPLMWTSLTLLTLFLPVLISFVSIQRHHRRSKRRLQGSAEERPLVATATEWRTPTSYRRFLWFCSSFLLWYAALASGEYLAYVYTETLPHSTKDGFYYVYSWIATVNILSAIASWVVSTKVRSWPLQHIYTLYFFMTYFIFYRNLFSRLQNPEQVVFIQLVSSLWVVFIYPLRMARWVYRCQAFVCRWGDDYPYEIYVKQLGRAFFLRNKAENATMLGFLCWVTVLHFGTNRHHYPHFRFNPSDDEFNYKYGLIVRASVYVWISELMSGRVVRCLFRWIYNHNISSEAVDDFRRYPHVVPVMVLVTIHVLQNILFGMIHLDFS